MSEIDLESTSSIIYGSGDVMPGCQMTIEDALAWAKSEFRLFEYCLVKDWRWLDVKLSGEAHGILEKRGLQPAVLYANDVVVDSRRRWMPGSWVRSTMLHRYDERGAFITLNTAYILIGDGLRQTTNPTALQAIV